MDDWEKAGKIASEAREYAKSLVKVDKSVLEVSKLIEKKIIDLNGNPAFPVNISINDVTAHYTALINDESKFKENDLVKVDLGVHINGAIGDTAVTVDLGNNRELVRASEEALNAAIKTVEPGVNVNKIGAVIHQVITDAGFSPIRNLSGHGLNLFKVHDRPTIPNFDNGDKTKLEEGQKIAIEPFASTGAGLIYEGKPSEIYSLHELKPIRNPNVRKILIYIVDNYKELPFAKRWLLDKFDRFNMNFSLNLLEKAGILYQYPQLIERKKGSLVSQAEHSLIVGGKVTTREC